MLAIHPEVQVLETITILFPSREVNVRGEFMDKVWKICETPYFFRDFEKSQLVAL